MSSIIAFVGGGNMARSLIGGLCGDGGLGMAPQSIHVAEPDAAQRESLAHDFGVQAFADNAEAVRGADAVVLAVKPQVMRQVCTALAEVAQSQQTLWISIAAGIRLGQIDNWLGGGSAVVRTMPNTPALIGAGITGLVANAAVHKAERAEAEAILQGAGETVWMQSEDQMDAVTAVSGSGPAYFLLLMESMEAAAIAQGLEPHAARRLVLQTALGSARLALAGNESPADLRRRVTSPNGTTAAAIACFEEGGFEKLVGAAIAAATRRGGELADAMAD